MFQKMLLLLVLDSMNVMFLVELWLLHTVGSTHSTRWAPTLVLSRRQDLQLDGWY